MKKKGLLVVCLACAPLLAGAGYSAYALTQVNQEVAHISKMAVSEGESDFQKFIDELNNFKNTFLIPLLAGSVGICSIVPVITALFNYLRTKKVVGQIKDADEKMNKAEEALIKVGNTLEKATTIMSSAEKTRMVVNNMISKINEIAMSNVAVAESIEKTREVLQLFAELEVKLAQISKDAVASGVIEDVSKLKSIITKI